MSEENDRLLQCTCEGNVEEVMKTLELNPKMIHTAMDWHQDRILALACWNGHNDLVYRLLEHNPKPDINAVNETMSTALHRAAYKSNVDLVDRLIVAGADYHAKDRMVRMTTKYQLLMLINIELNPPKNRMP